MHADTEACFALLRTCDFGFVHQVLTFTRERPGSLSTMSTQLNTHKASVLHLLMTYGSDYLTPEEVEVCLSRLLSEYYQFLGKNLLYSRNQEFWKYHQRKLTESGLGFSKLRLIRGLLEALGGAALHPKESVEKLRTRRKTGSSGHQGRATKPVALPAEEK